MVKPGPKQVGRKKRTARPVRKKAVRPKRAMRALKRRYKFYKFTRSRKPIAVTAAVGTVPIVVGTAIVAKGNPFGAAAALFGMVGAANIPDWFRKKGSRMHDKIVASAIGRPLIAKKLVAKERNAAAKAGLQFIGNLPFITAKETEMIMRREGARVPNLKSLKKFRCFSGEEIKGLRKAFGKTAAANPSERHKIAATADLQLNRMLDEKGQIIGSIAAEPVLSSMVFPELFKTIGANPMSRALGNMAISIAVENPHGGRIDFSDNFGKNVSIEFWRGKSGNWSLRKIERDKKL